MPLLKIEHIHQLFLKCQSACTDTRKIQPNAMFFALKGDNFNGNTYAEQALESGAAYCVIDDEAYHTAPQTILVKNVLETLQALATFHRNFLKTPIVALTGSNGKTTTKELINAVLSQKYKTTATVGNLNNHIGVPLTLLSMTKNTEIGIVEMGANHQKEIEFLCKIAQPDYGYITNFGKAHLEGFGGVEGVIKGKSEMYQFLNTYNKTIFVNGNDAIQMEKTKQSNRVVFGMEAGLDAQIEFVDAQPNVCVKYSDLSIHSHLIGAYNFSNIAAAICIGQFFKIEKRAIKTTLENYIPSNNRSQVLEKGSNKVIMDAYNANPTSMQAALLNFETLHDQHKIAFLGDMFELGETAHIEHQNIVHILEKSNITAILIGENFYRTETNSDKIKVYKTFDDFKNNFNISYVTNKTLLIKGSRGMAMERVLEVLEKIN